MKKTFFTTIFWLILGTSFPLVAQEDLRVYQHGIDFVQLPDGTYSLIWASTDNPPTGAWEHGNWTHDVYYSLIDPANPVISPNILIDNDYAQESACSAISSDGHIFTTIEDGHQPTFELNTLGVTHGIYDENMAPVPGQGYMQISASGGHSPDVAAVDNRFVLFYSSDWQTSGGMIDPGDGSDMGSGVNLHVRTYSSNGVFQNIRQIATDAAYDWWPLITGSDTHACLVWQKFIDANTRHARLMYAVYDPSDNTMVKNDVEIESAVAFYTYSVRYIASIDRFIIIGTYASGGGFAYLLDNNGNITAQNLNLPPIVRESKPAIKDFASQALVAYTTAPNGLAALSVTANSIQLHETVADNYNWIYTGIDGIFVDDSTAYFVATSPNGLQETFYNITPIQNQNDSPTVSITSPASGSTYAEGDNITINATAADSDGSVTLVEFYADGTKIGEDTTSPYSYTWTSPVVGSYPLRAVATDNDTASTTSGAVNITVGHTPQTQAPFGGSPWNIPGLIEAENYDLGGENIAYYDFSTFNAGGEFRSDNVDLSDCSEGGYAVGWTDNGEWLEYTVDVNTSGTYSINVRVASAINGSIYRLFLNGYPITGIMSVPNTGGWQTWQTITSEGVALPAGESVLRLEVVTGGFNVNYIEFNHETQNNPPTVNITSPTSGSTYTEGDNITINATAADSDGSVTLVEFYADGTKIGEDATSPYSYTWSSNAVGNYPLTAVATDNDTASTTSGDVNITVDPAAQTQGPFGGSPWNIPGLIEAENYDLGGENIAYYDSSSGNAGGSFRSDNVDLSDCSEGGYTVGWTSDGEWLEYTVDVNTSGNYSVDVRVASAINGSKYRLYLNGNAITGTINVPNTGGWQTWQTITSEGIALPAGESVLRLEVVTGGFNVNYIEFDDTTSATETQLLFDNFEGGWGNWTDGGNDCYLYTGGTHAHQGSKAAGIQDNRGRYSSFYLTNPLNVSSFNQLKIEFWYKPVSMDNSNEDFLLQYYDGSSWITVASWARSIDFENGNFYFESVTLDAASYNFPANASLRFMCDASGNKDDVYIDEISILGISSL